MFSVTCPYTVTVDTDGNFTVCVSVTDVCGVLMSCNQNISFALLILIAWNVFCRAALVDICGGSACTNQTEGYEGWIHLAILAYQRNRWACGTETS